MNSRRAIQLVEGQKPAPEHVVLEAWQHLVDTGEVWLLPGTFGRRAAALIESGDILPRSEVKQ